MSTAKELINKIEEFAPLELQESYDNSGLLIGDINQKINGVFVCLDIDNNVVECAVKNKCNMIISHHPLIFNPLYNLDFSFQKSKTIEAILKNNIVVYSTHTCFDNAKDSIAYKNLCKLNFNHIEKGIHFYTARTEAISVVNLAKKVGNIFSDDFVRYTLKDKLVKKVCHINGSGGRDDQLLKIMKDEDIDVFISSEFKYSFAKDLADNGIAVIELCHYNSEIAFLDIIEKLLKDDILVVKNTILECPFERREND